MSKRQEIGFAAAALMVTAGALVQLFGSDSHPFITAILLLPFGLRDCSEEERSFGRHASPFTKLCIVLGITLMACEFSCEFFPSSVFNPVLHLIYHPVFVVPLWLFLLWRVILIWHREKARARVSH